MLFVLQLSLILALQLGKVSSAALRPYDSLAGLSHDEVEAFVRSFTVVGAQPVPPALMDTSSKLVNDHAHPWKPLHYGDQRGPCPGLNTLASHGWLPRSGVTTPGQIITAVQAGFNMDWGLATLVTYAAFLVDGNLLTNLVSIGGSSHQTGHAPPAPALATGLNTHGTFEGDASMTRSDAFLGDNHSLNETLFDQIVNISKSIGGGKYTVAVAAEARFQRFQDSVARNPTFNFGNPRFATAFVEAAFPLAFFIDGRNQSATEPALDLDVMKGFFKDHRMPKDFHRREGTFDGGDDVFDPIQGSHDYIPGFNNGTVNNYVPDLNFMGTQTVEICALYEGFVNQTVKLYPNPRGALRTAVKKNLDNFFVGATAMTDGACAQILTYV